MQRFNMIMIYYKDKKLKKGLHVLEFEITINKKNRWFDVSSWKDSFLEDMLQMTVIAFVAVKKIIIMLKGCIYFATLCSYAISSIPPHHQQVALLARIS